MRITDIYIKNYRAFYGEHHISLYKDGKNLMVYIENGSHEEPETEEKKRKNSFQLKLTIAHGLNRVL